MLHFNKKSLKRQKHKKRPRTPNLPQARRGRAQESRGLALLLLPGGLTLRRGHPCPVGSLTTPTPRDFRLAEPGRAVCLLFSFLAGSARGSLVCPNTVLQGFAGGEDSSIFRFTSVPGGLTPRPRGSTHLPDIRDFELGAPPPGEGLRLPWCAGRLA